MRWRTDEPRADAVEPLVDGSCISTVNWSEVARLCVAVDSDPTADRAWAELDVGVEVIAVR